MGVKDAYRQAKADYEACLKRKEKLMPPMPAYSAPDAEWDAFAETDMRIEREAGVEERAARYHEAEKTLIASLLDWSRTRLPTHNHRTLLALLMARNPVFTDRAAEIALKAPFEECEQNV